MLDASPLGKLAHYAPPAAILAWEERIKRSGTPVIVPEIADFEVRRELLRAGKARSLRALDRLKSVHRYQPITTTAMLRAAELWADAHRRGRPAADPLALDGDVILAAQAIEAGAIVATENVGHLGRYVLAMHWADIVP